MTPVAQPLPVRSTAPPAPPAHPFRRPVAVIDIGSSAVRMAIADIDAQGGVTPYETLTQSLNLGEDTFTAGVIGPAIIKECIQILRSFRKVAEEYQIPDDHIRAVATSAVREAANSQSFLDRLYVATGLAVEALDDADTNRLMYLSVLPHLAHAADFRRAHTLVVEVGAGLTEALVLRGRDIRFSRVFRLGSLRLRELARESDPGARRRAALVPHIQRVLADMLAALPDLGKVNLVLLGGDMRFAAQRLRREPRPGRLASLPVKSLRRLAEKVLAMSDEQIVREHGLSFSEAGNLGPALLSNLMVAEAFGAGVVRVSTTSLRDGLLQELAARGRWTEEFTRQIVRSAVDLGRKYRFDETHARNVALAGRMLFDQTQPEHRLPPRYGVLLEIAALLHEVGIFISSRSHHKHSMYIIQNSDLFGLGPKDTLLVSLIARYHRRSHPKPLHEHYCDLARDERIVVNKLAALLRVADALCRQRGRPAPQVSVSREEARVVVEIQGASDISLEQQALREKGALFEEVFSAEIRFRRRIPHGN